MRYLCVVITCMTTYAIAHSDDATRPNIVFILADDLGWSDLGVYGHPYHRTPNLDRLADEGLRFTNGYAPAPICSASRASILTGKAVARLGFEFVTKNEPGHQQLDSDVPLQTPELTLNLPTSEVTIAEHLKALNYQTAFFGKWHVSQHYQRKYLAWHPDYGPRKQGFEVAVEDFGDHPYAWGKKKPRDATDGVIPADSMINRITEFIGDRNETDQPYFLMASSFYVHTPVKNRCRWLVDDYKDRVPKDSPKRNNRLEYAAFVETFDHHVGTILKSIDESGQRENTLVFFMSDNGGHPEYCANAPLRGSKWNLYEGGIRVPMICRWPQRIAAGTTTQTPVIGFDLLPTFVDLAGGEADSVDGVSITPLFEGHHWEPERSLIWHFPYYHPERTFSKAIENIGMNDFATSKTRPQSALRSGQYKLIKFAEDKSVELYDLSQDSGEQNDVVEELPEVVKALETELEQRLKEMNARRAIPHRR